MAADGVGLVLSNAEFCRYLSNADPARFSTQRLVWLLPLLLPRDHLHGLTGALRSFPA